MLAIITSLDLTPEMCVEVTCVTFRPQHVIVSAQFSSPLFLHLIRHCHLGYLGPWGSITIRILLLTCVDTGHR